MIGSVLKLFFFPLLAFSLSACFSPTLQKGLSRPAPEFSRAPATNGILARVANEFTEYDSVEYSGFKLLDISEEALRWRLSLIDSAVSSIDIQTYLWYPDVTGNILLERVVAAAQRGVHVRLVLDDLVTVGLDRVLFELDKQNNIQVRLFNPWTDRNLLSRVGDTAVNFERLNVRMHDKMMIVDGNAVIAGGRNIGDHYFGLNHTYNFHDLEVMGFGHIAGPVGGMFDDYWNSDLVYPVSNLEMAHDPKLTKEKWVEIHESNRSATELESFEIESQNWDLELTELARELHLGRAKVVYDMPSTDGIVHRMSEAMFEFIRQANTDLMITNAYVIPASPGIELMQELSDRGVRIRLLTNSLESHDVPAVNSKYENWRDDLILAGVELHELRADANIQSVVDTPPVNGEFIGLHTKAVVIDSEKVFIGSMNFDPRSAAINAEGGVFIESAALAADLVKIMERDMSPENAWQVSLDDQARPVWTNSETVLHRQPSRNLTERAMDTIFKILPRSQY